MTLFAATMALTVSLLPPTIFFYQGKQFLEGSVAHNVRLKSLQISALIGRNPELWRFESTRLDDILLAGLEKETYDVITQDGAQVTRAGPEHQPAPVFAVEARLYDAGKQAAVLSAHASLLPLLYQSFGLAILTTGVGVLSFIALKTIPTRLIHRAMDSASFLANHDPLTQLPNRSLFSEWLTRSMSEAAHNKTSLAVLTLDLDRFKEVNDIFGHAAGDTLLTQVTGRMEDVLEKTDFLARIGGDEFCVVQILVPQPASSARLSEKLVTELSRPFRVGNN
jgi:GGDEF domain-containing protein